MYGFLVFSFKLDPQSVLWASWLLLFKFVVIVLLVNRHIETNNNNIQTRI